MPDRLLLLCGLTTSPAVENRTRIHRPIMIRRATKIGIAVKALRKVGMTKQEIADYLRTEMKTIVEDDIKPCLLIGVPRGGYFSVPRLVLSCVDYLGALYCGWRTDEVFGDGRPNFTATRKAVKYLEDVFGEVFPEYRIRGRLLWEIYRHGTVHLNQPKALQNGARTISWYIFKGNWKERMIVGNVPTGIGTSVLMPVSHLVPMPMTRLPNDWILPICTTCLYEDLLVSLDVYADMIQKETTPTLESNFKSAVDEMVKPEQTTITWP